MWTHYCIVDRGWISVGKNEPCNWCDAREPEPTATACAKTLPEARDLQNRGMKRTS